MSDNGHVMLVGATGLVGRLCLPRLLERASREGFRVYAPTRRALEQEHACLRPIVAALDTPAGQDRVDQILREEGVRLECFACALGTTRAEAGSSAAFASVDRDLVVALGGIARRHGARQAVVVSSIGADPASPSFYLRVKGEMETGLLAVGFERADFLHPGLLLGQRDGRPRPGERFWQRLAPIWNPLMMGPLRRFGAIPAEQVARALALLVGRQGAEVLRYNNAAIAAMARTG